MKKAKEFDNILDECLERVLLKGETIEQCLAGHPEYAAELEPLLRTALDTKEATAIKPRPEFRERASYQFQAALREMEPQKARGFFSWQPQWVTAVIVVVILLMAGSGTVVAAGDSLPGEPLYQVKLATESVRLALTPSALGKAELYVELADKRVAEMIELADEGKVEEVEQAAELLSTHLVAMADLDVYGDEEELVEGAPAFEAATPQAAVEGAPAPTSPQVMVDEAPEPTPPQITVEEAIVPPQEAVEEAPMPVPESEPTPRAQVREVPKATPVPAPALEPAPAERAPAAVERVPLPVDKAPVMAVPEALKLPEDARPSEDEEGIELDEQAELRRILSRSAVENSVALQELLERAPESLKPALRRAIEQANAAYEQALKRLD